MVVIPAKVVQNARHIVHQVLLVLAVVGHPIKQGVIFLVLKRGILVTVLVLAQNDLHQHVITVIKKTPFGVFL